MFIECVAIVALILAMFFVYLRMGKKGIALTILPLVTVPFMHILGQLVSVQIAQIFSAEAKVVVLIFDVVALALSTLLSGCFSMLYKMRYRSVYLIVAGLFDVILTCILLVNL